MADKQAVIIGSGVIGCAVGLQLSRKGYSVTLVDKNPEVGYGSTSNSCAVVRFSYSSLATTCLLYTSPSPRDRQKSRMPSSA